HSMASSSRMEKTQPAKSGCCNFNRVTQDIAVLIEGICSLGRLVGSSTHLFPFFSNLGNSFESLGNGPNFCIAALNSFPNCLQLAESIPCDHAKELVKTNTRTKPITFVMSVRYFRINNPQFAFQCL